MCAGQPGNSDVWDRRPHAESSVPLAGALSTYITEDTVPPHLGHARVSPHSASSLQAPGPAYSPIFIVRALQIFA